MIIDGYSQPGASPNTLAVGDNALLLIELNGANAGVGVTGLMITAGSSTVRGFVINRFGGSGIQVDSSQNLITGNFIGTDVNGTAALGNGFDGVLSFSSGNTIGGTTLGARNVISGNQLDGISLVNAAATGNLVLGNYIGTDVNGTKAMGNTRHGISITYTTGTSNPSGSNNTIGGTTAGASNVISGNDGFGVVIFGPNGGASGNLVQGNFIGTDVNGTKLLGNNGDGVVLSSAPNNTIGGTTAAARNVISGNGKFGVVIESNPSTGNLVQGNFIGTDVNGTAALANANHGVIVQLGASGNTIGGTGAGARNVISGNGNDGVLISGASNNAVLFNFIGVGADGTTPLGNVFDGIGLNNASSNSMIGNVVSDNGIDQDAAGINLEANALNNIIAGNKIGTDVSGNKTLGNSLHGIFLGNGSSNNTIGGLTDNDRNVISGNGKLPITIRTSFSIVSIRGGVGVYIFGGDGANTSGNVVLNNSIGTNVEGTAALPNSVIGVLISQSSGNTVQGNLISGNGFIGLEIAGGTASGNQVQGNKIGTNFDGTAAIPNGLDGILINNAPNNTIGGTTAGAGNLISGNRSVGIQLFGPLTVGNVIEGNALGLDSAGRPTLLNRAGGIFVNTGPLSNQIGGTAPGQANDGQVRPRFSLSGFHQSRQGLRPHPAGAGHAAHSARPRRLVYSARPHSLTDHPVANRRKATNDRQQDQGT